MNPHFKLIITVAACAGLAWPAPVLSASEAGERSAAAQVERLAKPLIGTIAPGDKTLRTLLADGFEIIHVDAPTGGGSARFILRKGLDIYSCEPAVYREGGGQNQVHVISAPCLHLTPEA
jgi:hypothetical protein